MIKFLRLATFCLGALALSMPATAKVTSPKTAPAPAPVTEPVTSRDVKLATISGHAVNAYYGGEANIDCSFLAVPALKVISPPSHGTTSQVNQDIALEFLPTNPRYKCNGDRVPGSILVYTPAAGFVGHDQFEFLVAFSAGHVVDTKVDVDVK